MMDENKKTLILAGAAVILAILALLVSPGRITPEDFLDQGEEFFPEFINPNTAQTLEVIEYDDATGAARPFKVTFEKGRWIIPSHHNYPADAKNRLAQTAAGVIELRKDDFRTDNVSDHEVLGVIDPLDETATGMKGRGKRVTFKDENNNLLADLIIGDEVPDKSGYHFVRKPNQKRVYAVKMDFEVSNRFSDWIDTDLLQVDKNKIDRVTLHDYSINERTRRVEERDKLTLTKKDTLWSANKMKSSEKVDKANINSLLSAIDQLSIVGVRPKPEGLLRNLKLVSTGSKKLRNDELLSLQSKGFYITGEGELKSNEGEMVAHTSDGVVYTLRFGEVLYGTGLAVTAGTDADSSYDQSAVAENRYLFITTDFDASAYKEPPQPTNTDFLKKADSLLTDFDKEQKKIYDEHQKWEQDIEQARLQSEVLNARFADWYYVISAENFEKLNLSRPDLVVNI